MTAHAYYDFFAEKKAAEEPMIKMAKAMGIENASSGKDLIKPSRIALSSIEEIQRRFTGIRLPDSSYTRLKISSPSRPASQAFTT